MDSGATNHITSNLNNLSFHTPYHGADKVTIDNGKKLPITHIDTSPLQTLPQSNFVLYVPNILHVPSMTKNLLSVSQLTRQHNVIAEFHSNVCFIKDKTSGLVLLQGRLKDGLYRLEPASNSASDSKSAYSLECFSTPSMSRFHSCNRKNKCNSQYSFDHEIS